MASKQRYTATIELGDGKDVLSVDMLNLPYDMFGPEFPLEIIGPVDMGKCKGQPLPDMTDVVVHGEFDCSTCTINADTVLPKEISTLICKHSINSLDVLIGILPLSVRRVVVRPAIINAVKDSAKKNASDDSAYKNAIKFMEMYPDVTVTDGKKTLAEVIQEQHKKQESVKVKVATSVPAAPQIEAQTADWLSVNELVPVCEEKLGDEVLQKMEKDLKRYIRQALSQKCNVKFETREMKRSDGTKVKCIHQDDIEHVIEYIIDSVYGPAEVEKRERPQKKKTSKTKDVVVSKAEAQKYYIGNREIHKIKIKKYVSKAAWGQILSKVGKNTNALLDILQDIENINVNPALAHTASGQVVFIKDGQVQVSPTVGFKNGRCLAQGFGTLDDRPRIVWGICGNTFVCQNFYSAHEGKVKLEYNALLRTIDIDITKIDLKEYLLVSDLIKEIKDSRTSEKEEPVAEPDAAPSVTTAAEEKTVASDVVPETVEPPVVSDVVSGETAAESEFVSEASENNLPKTYAATEVPRKKRSRIIKSAPEFVAAQSSTAHECQKEEVVSKERTYRWASLYHLNGKLTAQYNLVVSQQQELLRALSGQSDTDKMLKLPNGCNKSWKPRKNWRAQRKQLKKKIKSCLNLYKKLTKTYVKTDTAFCGVFYSKNHIAR